MKRRISIVLLLILVLFVSAAAADTSTMGRVRVYGYKDEIKTPANMFAPCVVYRDVAHVENRFAEFHYIRENTYERHWQINIVNDEGKPHRAEGKVVQVFLPYPSIWSKADQGYWKWTQRYAQKHYAWDYALGYSIDIGNGEDYVTVYQRDEYRPVNEMEAFGPRIDIFTGTFGSGLTIWIKFEEL